MFDVRWNAHLSGGHTSARIGERRDSHEPTSGLRSGCRVAFVPTVRVERTLGVPIDRVFDLITDHAGYSRFRGVQRAELLREGETERNGVGALRRAHSRPLWFEEEIVVFERPTRIDYVIRRTNAPMHHEGASMVLEESGSGTRVVWTTTLEMTTPVLGQAAGAAMAPVLRRRLRGVLTDVERLAAEG